MKDHRLKHLLYAHSPSEDWHLEHPGQLSPRYRNIPQVEINERQVYLFDWESTLQESPIGLIRETRFTDVPAHINHDMELTFIYDGTCEFVINGRALSLKTGDILICNTGVVRSSPNIKGENDIVISMVFRKEFFDSVFLSRLPGASSLTNLLFDFVSKNRQATRYLVLPEDYARQARGIIELLYVEYHFKDLYSNELMTDLASALFLTIIQGLYRRRESFDQKSTDDDRIVRVLKHVEQEYKTCTLESAAAIAGYSPAYLSNLIKEKTGRTFSQIKLDQQLSEAAYLLNNTGLSITRVAQKVGISNMSYFYAKFKDVFGMTPKAYRGFQNGSVRPRLT